MSCRSGITSTAIAFGVFIFPMTLIGQHDGIREIAPNLGNLTEMTGSIAFLILGLATAMYGAFVQTNLRSQVRDATQLGQSPGQSA